MAKGDAAIGIPVPTGGWRTDVPIFQLPPNALSDGSNVVCNRDGKMTPRRGYEPLPAQPDLNLEPVGGSHRLMGGVAWSETGNQMIVVATCTHWWLLLTDGWQNITGDPQDSDPPNVPARFAQFGFVDGQSELYGVNGAGQSPMRRWHLTDPIGPYETMVDTAHGNFTLTANDILVVNNRLVCVNTGESGVLFPRRVRWSQVNDGGSYVPLAFNDLEGDAGNLICGQLSSRTTAIIYAQNGAWIMSATSGTDAAAFTFDRLNGAYAAPWSPAAIVNVGGVHYYLATDRHIWRCDGQSAQPISGPIDAGLLRMVATGDAQAPVALYDATQFRLWFFCQFVGDESTMSAVPYDLITGAWGVPAHFADGISMALPVIEQMGPTWDNPGVDANGDDYTWDTAPWANWNSIPETFAPALYIGLEDGLVCRFGVAVTDNGVAITYRAAWGQRAAENAREMFNIDTAEIYLDPITEAEPVDVEILGYQTPYDNAPVSILDVAVPQNDINQWLMQTDPPPNTIPSGSFKNAIFMQFVISGASLTGAPSFSGAWLFGNLLTRADKPVRDANQ